MDDRPQTLDEWATYVNQFSGGQLWSKAVAANSQRFVTQMVDEGYPMDDVKAILGFFVQRMMSLEMKLPEQGVFDLVEMARQV